MKKKVSVWRNGSAKNSNSTYGFRVLKTDYNDLKNWEKIKVGELFILRENVIFTENCPEIRSVIIKDFLKNNNLIHWEKGKPHKLWLREVEKNSFELLVKEPNNK